MPQSLARIVVHIVFSTKNRQPYLRDSGPRRELYVYMATILRDNVDSPAILINGVDDHLHGLVTLGRKFALMKVIEEAKTETSKWVKRQSPQLRGFAWQAGYGAFSVSESNIPQVRRYVENQEEHHKRITFQDERGSLGDALGWLRTGPLGRKAGRIQVCFRSCRPVGCGRRIQTMFRSRKPSRHPIQDASLTDRLNSDTLFL